MLEVRPTTKVDLPYIKDIVPRYFASLRVVSRGVIHDCIELPGFIAYLENSRVGLVQYNIVDDELEVVTLISAKEGLGVGRQLIEATDKHAADLGLRRCWLITTNNNHNAINFYNHIGWRLKTVHENAVDEFSRKLKPEIPITDDHGIAIRDEWEFERILEPPAS